MVAARPCLELSGCKPAAYLVIDRVEVWTIRRTQWWRDEVWCLALEQIDRLPYAVISCRILFKGEVIRELFDVGQEFLQESFMVVMSVYSTPASMKWRSVRPGPTDTINYKLLNVGRQRNKLPFGHWLWRHHLQRIFNNQHILKQAFNSINETL